MGLGPMTIEAILDLDRSWSYKCKKIVGHESLSSSTSDRIESTHDVQCIDFESLQSIHDTCTHVEVRSFTFVDMESL